MYVIDALTALTMEATVNRTTIDPENPGKARRRWWPMRVWRRHRRSQRRS